jgi:DNA-binding transcriptional MerR regulator
MHKIGDFASLSQIPVKTRRYYDEIGLLRPAHVEGATGYRYYGAEQLEQLNRILVLKDLGFSLREIRALRAGISKASGSEASCFPTSAATGCWNAPTAASRAMFAVTRDS